MTEQEIGDRLTELHSALVDKLGAQPFLDMTASVRQSGRVSINVYRDYNDGDYMLATPSGDTFAECLDDAAKIIAALPPCSERHLHDFMAQLGKLIDSGREKGIAVEFINPLKATMERLASNAITHRQTEAA